MKGVRFGAAMATAVMLGLPAGAAAATDCNLGANGLRHIVYIQFDNVHFRRDNPNVPSDLEQMPNLLGFLEQNGAFLTNHWTPLISHTAVDILTSLTGVYGDKMGVPIGNSFRYFNPNGTSTGAGSFAYWTDPLDSFASKPTDTTPEVIDRLGQTHPAPWVPFTRAGCDVGAFSVANIELENIGLDITTVFGANSPEAAEAQSNPNKAGADFEGISVHCARGSALCPAADSQPDLLPQEPRGYAGFRALFGNAFVQPQISPGGAVQDLDGTVIGDGNGNVGFPGFDPSAAQTLGYLAKMLEAGVPVVYGYIADAHDDHVNGVAFGPGQVGYVQQLAAFNEAFGKFFVRLAADGITTENTLFVITADENDHFAGGPPSPANCDGVTIPCTYAKIGEIDADLSRLLATESGNTTGFAVHADSAPTFYVNGNPAQTSLVTRTLEQDVGALVAFNPITGKNGPLTQAIADQPEQALLHMVTADPARTPTFIMFDDPDYFLFSSGSTSACSPLSSCSVEEPGFAWNHGDFQPQITNTWLGIAGPGVRRVGVTGAFFSDHTDIRPTIVSLAGLTDDYAHDGRVLFEVLNDSALPKTLRQHRGTLTDLAAAYKAINAPLGPVGMKTLQDVTAAIESGDAAYAAFSSSLTQFTAQRNAVASQMIQMIEEAEFAGVPLDEKAAKEAIDAALGLLADIP
jgi:hypothetical protein